MKKNLVLFTLVAGVLLAVVFLASHIHQKSKEEVLSQFNERQLLIARQTARQIELYFHARSQDIRYLSSLPPLQHFDVKTMRTDIQAYSKRLETVHIEGVFVLDEKGKIVYSNGADAIGSNHTRSDIYAWAKKPANKGMVRLVIDKTGQRGAPATGEGVKPSSPGIFLITPLYRESVDDGSPVPGGKFAGIILLTVDLEKMLAERTLLFEPTKKPQTLWIWIMDESGTLLLQSEHPSMVMRNIRKKNGECRRCHISFDYAEKIATEKQGTVEYQLKGRQKKIAAFAPMTFENASWIVVLNTPFEEVAGFIRGNFRNTLGLIGIVVVAMSLASFSMYRIYRQKVSAEEEIKHLREKQGLMESLRKTRDYLENLLDYANAPIIVWDPEFRITRFNRAFERLTGRSAEEVLGNPLDILFPADQREEAMGHIHRTMTGERWESVEIPILRTDGSVRIALWNSATLSTADGTTPIATIAQGQDITERKQAEGDIIRRNRELSVLHALGGTVAKTLDLRKILDSALEATLEALRIEGGAVYLLESDGETMEIYAHRGFSDEFIESVRKIRMGEGVSGRAAVEKKPIVLDVAEYPTERLAPYMVREGLRTIASTPLIAEGSVVGSLNLGTRRPHVFPPEELQMLASIGMQLGQAVRNAQLYESVKKEVTERKEAEVLLRESESRYRSLYEKTPEMLHSIDGTGRLISISDHWLATLGYARDEVLGRRSVEFLTEESRRYATEDVLPAFMRTGECKDVEYRFVKKNGEVIDTLLSATSEHDAEGNMVRSLAVVTDITSRKRSEEALKESEEKFRLIFDNANDGILLIDKESMKFEIGNRKICEMLGYSKEELVRLRLWDIHQEKDLPPIFAEIQKGPAEFQNGGNDGINISMNIPMKKKDSSVFFADVASSTVTIRGKQFQMGIFRDLTRERVLQKQAQMAQKMESVGTLAGGIAHDFNNVLTVIIGFGEMLKFRIANDPKAISDLDEVLRSAERAAVLTRQLLTFARRQVVEPVNLDLNEVMTDLVKLIRKVAREDIEIKTFPAKRPVIIHVDRGQIEQVLMNLCLNARDAMPEGGKLVIETGVTLLEEEFLKQYPYMKAGRYAVLSVSDTGVGMDEKTQEKVFEPFFTTKGPDKGTGLGLAMVYGIVKQHNGFIHVYSELGNGTTFRIYFPEVDAPADAKVIASQGASQRGIETILLADDDESVRKLTENIFSSYGYKVLTARDGEEAVDIFRRHQKEIAMAVLDVVMPKKGGTQAYDEMAKIHPGLKVLFLSGYSVNAIHESFVLYPGIPFLQKPFGPGALARKVREVLDKA